MPHSYARAERGINLDDDLHLAAPERDTRQDSDVALPDTQHGYGDGGLDGGLNEWVIEVALVAEEEWDLYHYTVAVVNWRRECAGPWRRNAPEGVWGTWRAGRFCAFRCKFSCWNVC